MPSSSRALRWLRPGPGEASSTVLKVDADPRIPIGRLELSCSATRNTFETERMMEAFDELAIVSLIRS